MVNYANACKKAITHVPVVMFIFFCFAVQATGTAYSGLPADSKNLGYRWADRRYATVPAIMSTQPKPAKPEAGMLGCWDAGQPTTFSNDTRFFVHVSDKGPMLAKKGRGSDRENKLEDKYKQWQNLSPAEKNQLRNRMKQYRQMSPQEQEQYQRRSRQWNQLSPEERSRIQQNLRRWEELSPAEQNAIRQRFRD
ncbi:MAG: DUF3106 domain-containing protein [Desulfobacterales bacterium]|jgi:hypothetical protein|nr:DUF3106 domain-containing protein [Desulfobacterales bacterium]